MRPHMFRLTFRWVAAAVWGVSLAGGPSVAAATEIAIGKIDKIQLTGDLRLRQENFHRRQGVDRSRQRFRLRLGTDLPFSTALKAKLRVASGTGEQISTNQSLDSLSSQKEIWIDRAELEYKPWPALSVHGGRMGNPLWTAYSSDVVWDNDFMPEGAGEKFSLSLFQSGRFFLNALQGVADEDSGTNTDQWYASGQAGVTVPLFADSRITLAAALHEWIHESSATVASLAGSATFGQSATQRGNRRLGSTGLANEFRVVELTAEVLSGFRGLPLSLQGTYVRNVAHRDPSVFAVPVKADAGYQAGLVLGKADGKGGWEFAYFRKYAEADATVSDVADSDFGDGGTNRKGNIAWIAYAPADYVVFQLKGFNTQIVNTRLNGGRKDDINRLQADVSVKF
jgi:hypothetical protein